MPICLSYDPTIVLHQNYVCCEICVCWCEMSLQLTELNTHMIGDNLAVYVTVQAEMNSK